MSDSLQPHGLQHTRPPCPSPTPGACSNSCPLSQWCHPTILFSVIPFSSCLQSFPALGCFQGVSSLHQEAKVLEFQLQHQFFQWLFRNDFLFLRIDQFDRQHFLLFLYKRDKQLFPKVSILHPSRCFFPPALPFHSEVLPTFWNLGSIWAPQFMTSVILVKFFKPLLFLSDFIRLLWGLNENMYVKFWVCSLAHSKYLKKYFYYWFLLSSSIFSPIYKHAQKSPVL